MEKDILAVHVAFTKYSPVGTDNVYQQLTYRFIRDFFIIPCSLVLHCSTPGDYPAVLIHTVIYYKGGKFKNFPVPLSWRFNFFDFEDLCFSVYQKCILVLPKFQGLLKCSTPTY